MTLTEKEIEEAIEIHERTREAAYQIMRDYPQTILGSQNWLRNSISESDIQISPAGDNLHCWGKCYSMQTMDNEWFDFDIPIDQIQKKMEQD